ncbi:MAG: hypothetical protein ABJZ55_15215 [Fuerstiella sp.]
MKTRILVGALIILTQQLAGVDDCSAGPDDPMPNNLVVKIEGIPKIPVHVSVDYFNFSDGGSSNLGFGAKVYYLGDDGTVELNDVSDEYDGIRIQVRNPTQRKLAIVVYDDKKEIARKASATRGETVTADIGRCMKPTTTADLTDFSLEAEDLPRVETVLKFLKTKENTQLNHHRDSPAGVAKGIVQYVTDTHGKVRQSERANWLRVEHNGGKNRELLGVLDFDKGSLVVGTRIQANGTELLRVQLAGSVLKAYQSKSVRSALEQRAVELSKSVFDEAANYPLSGDDDAEFNAGLRQDFGTSCKAASVHNSRWVKSNKGAPIEFHVESKIQTESATYYLVHVFELDPHRLSSFVFLSKRRCSTNTMLQ